MTWAEYQDAHPFLTRVTLASGAVQVFSRDPMLWRLTDWTVSSAVSGPSVILVPRARGND